MKHSFIVVMASILNKNNFPSPSSCPFIGIYGDRGSCKVAAVLARVADLTSNGKIYSNIQNIYKNTVRKYAKINGERIYNKRTKNICAAIALEKAI